MNALTDSEDMSAEEIVRRIWEKMKEKRMEATQNRCSTGIGNTYADSGGPVAGFETQPLG